VLDDLLNWKNGNGLPASPEAERGVLGSMLLAPLDAIPLTVESLSSAHFVNAAHSVLFDELAAQWQANARIDLITFTQHLRDRRLLQKSGGASYVTELFTFVPTATAVNHYIEILREKFALREIIQTCRRMATRAQEHQDDVGALIEECSRAFVDLGGNHGHERISTRELTMRVLESLNDYESVFGISTGFPQLDAAIGGLAPGAKIVLAGQISGGKSAFAQNVAVSLAVVRHLPVAIFSFEMTDQQTMRRLLQIHSGVSIRAIVNRTADVFENDEFIRKSEEVGNAPVFISSERLSVAQIRARIMQLRPRLAVIDYLQIIPEKKQKGENRTDQLDRMSAETKQMAGGLGFPLTVFELSQQTSKEDGKMMTRGSRGIEADSDILLGLEGENDPGETLKKDLVVHKNRDGEIQTRIPLRFHKPTTRFREVKSN
jgi:replicative DNA helicase